MPGPLRQGRALTETLLGAGRSADVYEVGGAWVLCRDRDGWGDAAAEGAVMAYVREHGYPAPRVRPTGSRTELVMERLSGPAPLTALPAGEAARSAGRGGTPSSVPAPRPRPAPA
ncbi:hypothetical protein SAMN05216533_6037 [Streptomyces sp. Ag109_O5-10]|nr:hypothetical protein SAMN05216533_6037 [Streptomyces sp. Ag109_O5-10]